MSHNGKVRLAHVKQLKPGKSRRDSPNRSCITTETRLVTQLARLAKVIQLKPDMSRRYSPVRSCHTTETRQITHLARSVLLVYKQMKADRSRRYTQFAYVTLVPETRQITQLSRLLHVIQSNQTDHAR